MKNKTISTNDPAKEKIKFIIQLFNSSKLIEAKKEINNQLISYPKSSILFNFLGAIFFSENNLQQALINYNNSVKINPEYADAHNNLGVAYKKLEDYEKSITSHKKAIEIQPNHANAHNNLGVIYKELKEYKKSIYHYERSIQINPNFFTAYSNLGNVYRLLNEYKKAMSCHEKAIQINPKYSDAYNNLGTVFELLNEIEKANVCFEQAIKIDPNFAEAQHNQGLILLLKSNFEKGFEKYEWRRKIPSNNFYRKNTPNTQEWQGEDLTNKTILILAEQGIGDIIQFARYLYILSNNYSTNIIFKINNKRLIHLFSNSKFKIITDEDPVPNHDFYKYLMSLPQTLYKKTKNLPKQINYIKKNTKVISKWEKKLSKIKGTKVGIAWQGNTSYKLDSLRSIPLNFFEPLFTIDKINFINLQKDKGTEQIKNFKHKSKLYDFSYELDNGENAFEDTMGILNNIDLVISADTALSHLSATLSIRTWLLLPFVPDWRNFLKIEHSPWYESVKIYRNNKSNAWDKVFSVVKKNLIDEFIV